MKIINSYHELPISRLQSTRLYLQGRPLLHYWSRMRHGGTRSNNPIIDSLDKEITGDYVAVDCAGWVFATDNRQCTAIELHDLSLKYWHRVHFEYDYLTWHPTYLESDTVLAYFCTYFKYCTLEDFLTFCKTWSQYHRKIIIGIDPTKIKYNYFKFQLLDLLRQHLPGQKIKILQKENFSLVFTLT